MHVANQLLFKALIILGKKLFPNLNNAKCVLLMQFFSLFSHRVHFDVCPTYGIFAFLAHHGKIDQAI